MSARNYGRSTRVEDYYSDEELMAASHHNTPVQSPRQQHRPSPQRPINRNSRLRSQYNDPNYYDDESLDEEEVQRAMYEFGLEDRPYYQDTGMSPSPGYYVPSRFNEEDLYYPRLPHLQERYAPPPPPPPPPLHWMQQQQRMRPENDMMYSPQSPMDLPFAHRSASSRSYNSRRNPPNHRMPRRTSDFFPSHDEDDFENDVNEQEYYRYQQRRPTVSRQNSNGSNASRRTPKRRSNSLSGPPPMMDPPHYYGRNVRSDPNSPQNLSSESSDDDLFFDQRRPISMDGRAMSMDGRQPMDGRPLSMDGRSPMDGRVPMNEGRRPLGRSLSFQGYPQSQPPQPQGNNIPQMMMHPPPPPPLMNINPTMPNMMENPIQRNNSMFNLASGTGGDFFSVDPIINTAQIPTSQAHENNGSNVSSNGDNMHWMGGAPLPGFPTSPGNPMFNSQHTMMNQNILNPLLPFSMFNNPMMPPPPPPPPQPMWNFMNPQDMWFGQQDFPLPFMNSSDPNLIINAMNGAIQQPALVQNPQAQQQQQQAHGSPGGKGNENTNRTGEEKNPHEKANEMMHNPNEMNKQNGMDSQQEPMLRRGLSLLGGLFGGGNGGGKKNYGEEFQPMGGFPAGNFSVPMQGQHPKSKKEEKLTREYQKLGSVWCWRIADSEDGRFQSFSIPNQKIIKRKSENPESRTRILLGKEKKLRGDIMVDLNQFRGGCMTTVRGQNQFLHLEIKEEPFDVGNTSFVFDNR